MENRVRSYAREMTRALPRITLAIRNQLNESTLQLQENELREYGVLVRECNDMGIITNEEFGYFTDLLGDCNDIRKWRVLTLAERVALSKLMEELVNARRSRQN